VEEEEEEGRTEEGEDGREGVVVALPAGEAVDHEAAAEEDEDEEGIPA